MKMLPHFTRLCISMLIVLAFCQVSASYKPIMLPDSEELIIDEGKPLNITCLSYTEIKFEYPYNPKINTSNYTIYYDYIGNSIRNYTFQRPHTVFSDTGWYSCADINVEITRTIYNPEVKWLYVYVRSNKSAFVEGENTTTFLSGTIDGSTVIPCRTTLPFLDPILIKIYDNNIKDEVHKATFDSKIGFTITNLKLEDGNMYQCLEKIDDKEHKIQYKLNLQPRRIVSSPKNLRLYYKRERNLYVNCTLETEVDIIALFINWSTPQQDSSRKDIQRFKVQHRNTLFVTSQLTIFNVTEQDSGDYWCIITTIYEDYTKKISGNTKEIIKNILIPNQEKMYIELISNTNYYRKESGSDIELTALAYYKFPIILQWFKPNGEEIVHSPKYFISFRFKPNEEENVQYLKNVTSDRYVSNITEAHLKIISLSILDSGNYMLQAKNPYTTKTLSIMLDVTVKPIPILIPINSHRLHNESSTEFRCEVKSNPPPNITWNFLKYPNDPSFENSPIVHTTNVTQNAAYNSSYIFESIAKMSKNETDISGKITCEACNEVGCNSATRKILGNIVSDREGVFKIIGPIEPVVKGDNIELVCAAPIYNYTNEFTWTTAKTFTETERVNIMEHKTSFIHRSTLTLINVQEPDAGYYTCTIKMINKSNTVSSLKEKRVYELVIHDPISPFFTKTNMNKTKTRIIDIITECHDTILLQCHADGMPKPQITWYKNNMLLKENDRYFFKYNQHELHLKYLMQHDSGKYSCRAVSRSGTNETYQQITVKNRKWRTLDTVLVTSIPILGFILIILATFVMIKIYHVTKMRKELTVSGLMYFEEGALEYINPDLTVDEQAELLPYDKKWEFPRERLKLKEQIGSGNFGVVMKAEAIGICKKENVTTVAVKMVHRTNNPIYIRALASELKIMVHLGKHLNVVNLLGACTKNISKGELFVIVEYCRLGNLQNYLLRHRNNFINQINPKSGKHDFTIGMDILTRTVNVSNDHSLNTNSDVMVHYCPESNAGSSKINFLSQPQRKPNYSNGHKDKENTKPICTQDLLSWAFQVARGMEYLSQRKVLHGDLAARNILLTENNVVKICDFGLAKNIHKDGSYKNKSNAPLPVKWMAIESIRDRIFSTQSDVWSFGIMLWEFFTLAEMPYTRMEEEEQYQQLIKGYRMQQPDYAISEVYDIMLQCWIAKPMLRPNFTHLVKSIGNLLEEDVKMHFIELNNSYMDINMMNLNNKKDYLSMMSAPDHARILSLPIYKCLNSKISKDTSDSSYMNPSRSTDESTIFRPRSQKNHSHIEISSTSDSKDVFHIETEDVEEILSLSISN